MKREKETRQKFKKRKGDRSFSPVSISFIINTANSCIVILFWISTENIILISRQYFHAQVQRVGIYKILTRSVCGLRFIQY